MLDFNGDGMSEMWKLMNPGLEEGGDFDGDGRSNFLESISGTDPANGGDFLKIQSVRIEGEEIKIQWNGVEGKVYTVQKLESNPQEWVDVLVVPAGGIARVLEVGVPLSEESEFFRVSVVDVDADQDGLTAWEEAQLGWSDEDAFSSGMGEGGDYEEALRLLESESGAPLASGGVLPRRRPSEEEASRFLVQASFGPTTESIEEVADNGMLNWFDDQMSLPVSKTQTSMFATGKSWSATLWRHGWWRSAIVAPDQLRHRMAYALSQILVVNTEPGTVVGDNSLTQAIYYDGYLDRSFGEYRDLLDFVTYSPVMGFYLSHLNNRKSDPSVGRFPDENYAREIMQLFSIGLWELNQDGSRKVDGEGNFISTYDNGVITELAKVFTGMSHSYSLGKVATSFYDPVYGNDYQKPLKVWDEEHEQGEKVLFGGVVVPAGQTGEEDVQQTLDALCEHPNVGPFMARLLIQRFTTSNPSPQYISRVSEIWQRSEGDLGRVVRAIIFDPEARTPNRAGDSRGMVREPLLRLVHLQRAFAKPDSDGKYGVQANTLKEAFGQFAMSAPTVFNFYSPDHSPEGELREMGLFAPEIEIATTGSLLATHDELRNSAFYGHWSSPISYQDEEAMIDDLDMVMDHLDVLLTYGTLPEDQKALIKGQMATYSSVTQRVQVAVQLIVTSPTFSVLK
ncbi:MAG: DUF1800 domain-containing protein [Verrucomicrobiaceae bacterium]